MPRFNHPLTSRLAANVGVQQFHVLDMLDELADDTADEIDRIIARVITIMNFSRLDPTHQQIVHLLSSIPDMIVRKLLYNLDRAVAYSSKAVALALVRSLPAEYLPIELLAREWKLTEHVTQITEAERPTFYGLKATFTQPLFPKLEPIISPVISKTTLKDRFRSLLIEPIKKTVAEKIVFGGRAAIDDLINRMKFSYDPWKAVRILAAGIGLGKDRTELAADLRQELAITKAAARRIARTEGTRVANATNMESYNALGDAVIGFQLHSVLDERTRPWHRQRNGTIYYKQPKENQKSLYQMPHPPKEPADPNERPTGTPDVAFNCRCFLSPVFVPVDDLPALSKDAQDRIVPDQLVYQDWWKDAPERLKRKAVGSRRYSLVTSLHGEDASYFHFIEPDTGELMPLDDLRSEDGADTVVRVMQGRQMANQARMQRREVLTTGSY